MLGGQDGYETWAIVEEGCQGLDGNDIWVIAESARPAVTRKPMHRNETCSCHWVRQPSAGGFGFAFCKRPPCAAAYLFKLVSISVAFLFINSQDDWAYSYPSSF